MVAMRRQVQLTPFHAMQLLTYSDQSSSHTSTSSPSISVWQGKISMRLQRVSPLKSPTQERSSIRETATNLILIMRYLYVVRIRMREDLQEELTERARDGEWEGVSRREYQLSIKIGRLISSFKEVDSSSSSRLSSRLTTAKEMVMAFLSDMYIK